MTFGIAACVAMAEAGFVTSIKGAARIVTPATRANKLKPLSNLELKDRIDVGSGSSAIVILYGDDGRCRRYRLEGPATFTLGAGPKVQKSLAGSRRATTVEPIRTFAAAIAPDFKWPNTQMAGIVGRGDGPVVTTVGGYREAPGEILWKLGADVDRAKCRARLTLTPEGGGPVYDSGDQPGGKAVLAVPVGTFKKGKSYVGVLNLTYAGSSDGSRIFRLRILSDEELESIAKFEREAASLDQSADAYAIRIRAWLSFWLLPEGEACLKEAAAQPDTHSLTELRQAIAALRVWLGGPE